MVLYHSNAYYCHLAHVATKLHMSLALYLLSLLYSVGMLVRVSVTYYMILSTNFLTIMALYYDFPLHSIKSCEIILYSIGALHKPLWNNPVQYGHKKKLILNRVFRYVFLLFFSFYEVKNKNNLSKQFY